MPEPSILTLGDVARRYGCPVWKLRRLYERGKLPPAERAGQYRVVRPADLPTIEAALRRAGYIRQAETELAAAQ